MGEWQQARLLPWLGPEGQQCRLVAGEEGFLSKLADSVEEELLDSGTEVAQLAPEILEADGVSTVELRWVGRRLLESLRDALRVAESRNERLPVPEYAREHPEQLQGTATAATEHRDEYDTRGMEEVGPWEQTR